MTHKEITHQPAVGQDCKGKAWPHFPAKKLKGRRPVWLVLSLDFDIVNKCVSHDKLSKNSPASVLQGNQSHANSFEKKGSGHSLTFSPMLKLFLLFHAELCDQQTSWNTCWPLPFLLSSIFTRFNSWLESSYNLNEKGRTLFSNLFISKHIKKKNCAHWYFSFEN